MIKQWVKYRLSDPNGGYGSWDYMLVETNLNFENDYHEILFISDYIMDELDHKPLRWCFF